MRDKRESHFLEKIADISSQRKKKRLIILSESFLNRPCMTTGGKQTYKQKKCKDLQRTEKKKSRNIDERSSLKQSFSLNQSFLNDF